MLDKLKSDDFAGALNETFRLRLSDSESLDFQLVEVTELGETPGDEAERRRPFSVVFRGPEDAYLPQSIYRLEHEKLGTLEVFLVPIGPGREGMRFEAVFT